MSMSMINHSIGSVLLTVYHISVTLYMYNVIFDIIMVHIIIMVPVLSFAISFVL